MPPRQPRINGKSVANNPTVHSPLTIVELKRLADFLASVSARSMNLESLDGYFAALICGPDEISPREYLHGIWGEEFVFMNEEQATDIFDLIMRHWNTIALALQQTLNAPNTVYLPLLLLSGDGFVRGNDWAKGFIRGVGLRAASWRALFSSGKHGSALLPFVLLAHEHDPYPPAQPIPAGFEKREALLQAMIASLPRIYRHFEQQRRTRSRVGNDNARLSRQHAMLMTGHNEPCPCGSGKKYKHCCAPTPTRH